MIRQEAAEPDIDAVGAFSIFMNIWTKIKACIQWFSHTQEDYPSDEAGELMKRYMERKNWFDKISSWWVELPLTVKISYLTGFTLLCGLTGVFFGAPTLMIFVGGFLSIAAHKLFVSNEQERYAGAKILAAETIILNKTLSQSQSLFTEAFVSLACAAEELQNQGDDIKEQAKALDAEKQRIQQTNEALVTITAELTSGTDNLLENEDEVRESFAVISLGLRKYNQTITESVDKTENLSNTVSQFSTIVQELQQSQQIFSQAANRFSQFVHQRPLVQQQENDIDDYTESLREQNDEDEALIEEWTRLYPNGA